MNACCKDAIDFSQALVRMVLVILSQPPVVILPKGAVNQHSWVHENQMGLRAKENSNSSGA